MTAMLQLRMKQKLFQYKSMRKKVFPTSFSLRTYRGKQNVTAPPALPIRPVGVGGINPGLSS